jgi:hypothetical protein
MLTETLPRFGLKAEDLSDYVSIFKYGCPPHGGFAIGLERLTQQILGLANVKEASLFPPGPKARHTLILRVGSHPEDPVPIVWRGLLLQPTTLLQVVDRGTILRILLHKSFEPCTCPCVPSRVQL